MKPFLTPDSADDAKARIAQFVRWHCDNLNAPATQEAIGDMIDDKFNAPNAGVCDWCKDETVDPLTAWGVAAVFVADMVKAGELRFVAHEFLPDGYSTVEDPS